MFFCYFPFYLFILLKSSWYGNVADINLFENKKLIKCRKRKEILQLTCKFKFYNSN